MLLIVRSYWTKKRPDTINRDRSHVNMASRCIMSHHIRGLPCLGRYNSSRQVVAGWCLVMLLLLILEWDHVPNSMHHTVCMGGCGRIISHSTPTSVVIELSYEIHLTYIYVMVLRVRFQNHPWSVVDSRLYWSALWSINIHVNDNNNHLLNDMCSGEDIMSPFNCSRWDQFLNVVESYPGDCISIRISRINKSLYLFVPVSSHEESA